MASSTTARGVPEPLSAKYKESFAYATIKDRLPVILTNVIDTLYRDRNVVGETFGPDAQEETKEIIGRLSKLRNELVTDKPVVPLTSNGVDVLIWNKYLDRYIETFGMNPAWYQSPWLYVECYLYRRIKEAFELSAKLQNYDPFRTKKENTYISSLSAVSQIAISLQKSMDELHGRSDNSLLFKYFKKFLEICLWGNKCDLSMFVGREKVPEILSQVDDLQENILTNESESLWNTLQQANQMHKGKVRLDLVLDNAGFELFTDLCFLHLLDCTGLINQVYMYVKTIPWYVSDTTVSDFHWLLKNLHDSQEASLSALGKQWTNNVNSGKWIIEEEIFWTLPYDYSEMEAVDNALYKKLSNSHVIIFKGDLNYRKLTGDLQWEVTTPFRDSLRGFLPATLFTLRTIKADVVAGLKPGVKEEVEKQHSDWMFSGDFALIQCCLK